MHLPNPNYLEAATILTTLIERGVRHAVISPGSRSTPLAACAAQSPDLQSYVLYDERSAGFFALGLAKGASSPVLLVCTSGTATANYFPAVIEASHSNTPLIVLTADRPKRLRHCGAPQTINQVNLYGSYARWFVDLPEARLDVEYLIELRQFALDAFHTATSHPCGPVHINIPFDEPLSPIPQSKEAVEELWRKFKLTCEACANTSPPPVTPEYDFAHLVDIVQESTCGILVAGPYAAESNNDALAIHHLGKKLGWPILADIGSGLRFFGSPVVPYYDIFLRNETLCALSPDLVIEFGSSPVSNALNRYLDRHRAHTIRLQPDATPRDPSRRANRIMVGKIASLVLELADRIKVSRDSLLLDPFSRAAIDIDRVLTGQLQQNAAAEIDALFVREAIRSLPDCATLVLANSLAIRYADALSSALGKQIRTLAMRGASGIDGTVSHAAGAAVENPGTLLITGDLALLHDLNGLYSAAKYAKNLAILLLNNNGGGIFHHLPIHAYEETGLFECIHGTPHYLKLSAASELFGIKWIQVKEPAAIASVMSPLPEGVYILEAQFNRSVSATAYRTLIQQLCSTASG